jgi:hypothetical protein
MLFTLEPPEIPALSFAVVLCLVMKPSMSLFLDEYAVKKRGYTIGFVWWEVASTQVWGSNQDWTVWDVWTIHSIIN